MAIPVSQEIILQARKAGLRGAFTCGVGGWFLIERKGWGWLALIVQIVCLPLIAFTFPVFLSVWVLGILLPQWSVRRDAVHGIMIQAAEQIQQGQHRERLEEN